RRPGRPRRQHLRILAALLRHDQLRRRPPAAAVRPPAPAPAPYALADLGADRHPGVARDRPDEPAPAPPDQARTGWAAAGHRLHDARPHDDLFPLRLARQLRQELWPEYV